MVQRLCPPPVGVVMMRGGLPPAVAVQGSVAAIRKAAPTQLSCVCDDVTADRLGQVELLRRGCRSILPDGITAEDLRGRRSASW